ncbi:hypothetical protein K525DRAFT_366780 [Schizophyllum commune Loenen D]|nr:hypothetical protein K525DRAFT_366780 [Schizophyllum commune Loenen D]
MGKWTPEYYDDVLHAKMRSMITAAIMRAKQDKSEPSISYERFVEQLDSGDSFTASIMDVLVKEIADRSSRPNQRDRRLIASNTAQTLTKLASPLRVYRPRTTASRRSSNLASYLTRAAQDEYDEPVVDEFESTVDSVAAQESARFSSNALYENAAPWTRRWHSPDEETPIVPNALDDVSEGPRTRLPGSWRPARSALTSSLSRHPSLHRAPRVRTADFSDFTSRRRNSLRESLGVPREGSAEPGAAEGSTSTSTLPPLPSFPPRENATADRHLTRRFFPFSRSLPLDSSASEPSPPWSNDVPEPVIPLPPPRRWRHYPLSASPSPPRSPPRQRRRPERDGEALGPYVPPLRRGGLGAPEVLDISVDADMPWAPGTFGRMISQNSPEPPTMAPVSMDSEFFNAVLDGPSAMADGADGSSAMPDGSIAPNGTHAMRDGPAAYPTPPVMPENEID